MGKSVTNVMDNPNSSEKGKLPPRNIHHKLLSPEERSRRLLLVEQLTAKHNRDGGIAYTPIVITGRDSHGGAGTNSAKQSTIDRYESTWSNLLDFALYIEDYESCIILHRPACPPTPSPVSSMTASLYVKYCTMAKGEIVTDPLTGNPFLVGQSPLTAIEVWNVPVTINLFINALTKVHSCYASTQGQYFECCPQCMQIPLDEIRKGVSCINHPGSARRWRSGSVTRCPKFLTVCSSMSLYAKDRNKSRSCVSFLPSELRRMYRVLQSRSTLEGLMLWSMIILGCRLFLRIDEVLQLEVDSFVKELFVVKGDRIVALCVKIKGKRDLDTKHLMVYDDPLYPDLSPVRPFLFFIAASGRRSGYIFTTLSQIRQSDGSKPYEYRNILRDIRNLTESSIYSGLTFEGKKRFVGTHCLRKTAFLLAYWGIKTELVDNGRTGPGLPVEDEATILLDARHGSVLSTKTYLQDAGTTFGLYHQLGKNDLEQRIGRYSPIYVHCPENILAVAREGDPRNGPNQRSLPELADWFLFDLMSVSRDLILPDHLHSVWVSATSHQFEGRRSWNSIFTKLSKFLSPSDLSELRDDLTYYYSMSRRDAPMVLEGMGAASLGTNQPHPPSDEPPHHSICDNTAQPANTALQACERTGPVQPPIHHHTHSPEAPLEGSTIPNSPEARTTPAKLPNDYIDQYKQLEDPRSKILLILRACHEIRDSWKTGTGPPPAVIRWYYRAAKIEQCVQTCFHGSIDRFLTSTKASSISRFQCCNGVKHRGTKGFSKKSRVSDRSAHAEV